MATPAGALSRACSRFKLEPDAAGYCLQEKNRARTLCRVSDRRGGEMADTEDLSCLKQFEHAGRETAGVNGVKVGETLTGRADGNAELRPVNEPGSCSVVRRL